MRTNGSQVQATKDYPAPQKNRPHLVSAFLEKQRHHQDLPLRDNSDAALNAEAGYFTLGRPKPQYSYDEERKKTIRRTDGKAEPAREDGTSPKDTYSNQR